MKKTPEFTYVVREVATMDECLKEHYYIMGLPIRKDAMMVTVGQEVILSTAASRRVQEQEGRDGQDI